MILLKPMAFLAIISLISSVPLLHSQESLSASSHSESFLTMKSMLSVASDQYISDNGYPQSCSSLDNNCIVCSSMSIDTINLLSNGDFENTESTDIDISSDGISETFTTESSLPGGWYSSSAFLFVYSKLIPTFQVSLTDYSAAARAEICQDITTHMNKPYVISFDMTYTPSTVSALEVAWDDEVMVVDYSAQGTLESIHVTLLAIADSAVATLCFRYSVTTPYEFGYVIDDVAVVRYNPEVCEKCSSGFFYNSKIGYCSHCYESIASCMICSGDECFVCESGFRLNADGSCTRQVKECAEYGEKGKCHVCKQGFKAKSVSNQCVTVLNDIQLEN